MASITYGVIEEKYIVNNISRMSYGIAIFLDAEKEGATVVVASVHDICSDKKKVSNFAKICNRLDLSDEHIQDAVNDYFVE